MDLRNDIKKATSLTFKDNDAKFFRLQELSQAAKDRKMNERTVRKPRNIHLLEDSDTESNDTDVNISSKVKPTFDKYEISAAVKEVNGGRDLSNKHWEENFFRNLEDMTQCGKDISQNFSKYDNVKVNKSEAKDLNDKYIKKKDKLYRNAAIMGLVKTKKISIQDLISSSNENSTRKEDELGTHETAFNGFIMDDDKYYVESVPLREDSEIYVHPLQMGIDKKQFKDIDFSVSRIGKKIKTTPTDYFLGATDDTFFNFVKNKNST